MATRELLFPVQRQRFTELPDPMGERLLARHHTLSEEDLRVIGSRRRPETKLGFTVLLCYLRFPGRSLRAGERPPRNLLEYVAAQLGEKPAAFDEYVKGRDTTRREHLVEIVPAFGFRSFDEQARRDHFEFLLPVAMGTDRGTALVETAVSEMRARAIVSPAITTVEELCWEARRGARESVLRKLTTNLSPETRRSLDQLLEVPMKESRAGNLAKNLGLCRVLDTAGEFGAAHETRPRAAGCASGCRLSRVVSGPDGWPTRLYLAPS